MTHEDRVLDAFTPNVWMRQLDVCDVVPMATADVLSALARLVDAGLLETGKLRSSDVLGRGRYSHIYRLAMRKTVAA